ncbi:MAG TPA: NPCBM/NEW2 domain-containing protein [Tepidisphaeraceae bacterium]
MFNSIVHPPSSILVFLCVLCASAVNCFADDGWSLTTADFKRQIVNLKSFDDAGAHVVPYGETAEAVIPLDKLLQLDRGGSTVQQVRGAWTLYLTSGDRIGGEPAAITNDNLTWKSPAAGDLTIPVAGLRAIVKGQDAPTFDPNRTEDAVFLANGDNVKGIVTGIEAGKVSVKQSTGDVLPIDLSAARAIHFAAAKTEQPTGRAFRVQLSDGSVVTAPRVSLPAGADKLTLTLRDNSQRPIEVGQVVLIEQLNGPVSWLSARTPKDVVYQPMFDVNYPPQMDHNYRGERIKFQGREFARGIGVHAYCKLTYALDGSFKAFRTQYALSDDAYKGKVTVRILLDDKVVHEARDFGPGKLSPVILLDVSHARTLSLEAHPGGDTSTDDRTKWHIDTQARLNWIEPALLKEMPKPEAPKTQPAATTTAKTPPAAAPTQRNDSEKPADSPKPDNQ